MIATGEAAIAIHALLHHDPLAITGDEEAMQIKLETVLHGGAVDLGDEAACFGQGVSIEADLCTDPLQFGGRLPGVPPSPTADMQAELARERRQPALQCADHARGDA